MAKIEKTEVEAINEARRIMDAQEPPKGLRQAWMNRETFLALGGSQERWASLPGDDEVKLVHL